MGVPALSAPNYPYRRTTTYPSGITTIVDDAAGAVYVIHPIGTTIEILGNGQINVQGAAGISVAVQKDAILTALGAVTVNAQLGATVNTPADAVVNCANAEVFASVDAYIKAAAFIILQGGIVSINPP